MTTAEKIAETEKALAKTKSWKCRNDLTKYLKRLRREQRTRSVDEKSDPEDKSRGGRYSTQIRC